MIYNRSRVVSDNLDVGIHIWGPPGATIAVDAATGDLTAVGGTGFTVDMTTYNTFGKVIDYINSWASEGWKAKLIDSKRSDDSQNTLITRAATGIPKKGLGLLKDTAVALNLGVGITNQDFSQNDVGVANIVTQIVSLNTFIGTSIIYVYELNDEDPSAPERILAQWAGGATTVEQTLPVYGQFENLMAQGRRLLVQMIGSAACTGRLGVNGISKPLGPILA